MWLGCLLALIGWQFGVAGGWFKSGRRLAGLDLHEGGSWRGLGLIWRSEGLTSRGSQVPTNPNHKVTIFAGTRG